MDVVPRGAVVLRRRAVRDTDPGSAKVASPSGSTAVGAPDLQEVAGSSPAPRESPPRVVVDRQCLSRVSRLLSDTFSYPAKPIADGCSHDR